MATSFALILSLHLSALRQNKFRKEKVLANDRKARWNIAGSHGPLPVSPAFFALDVSAELL